MSEPGIGEFPSGKSHELERVRNMTRPVRLSDIPQIRGEERGFTRSTSDNVLSDREVDSTGENLTRLAKAILEPADVSLSAYAQSSGLPDLGEKWKATRAKIGEFSDFSEFERKISELPEDEYDLLPIRTQRLEESYVQVRPLSLKLGKNPELIEKTGEARYRLYLNPPRALIPDVAARLVLETHGDNSAFHFKFLDPRDTNPVFTNLLDQMVIYISNDEDVDSVLAALDRVATSMPTAFKGREVPPLSLSVREGIGFAQQPQDPNHSGISYRSFHLHRKGFLKEAYKDSFREGMTDEQLLPPLQAKVVELGPSWNINPRNLALNLNV